MQGLSGAKAVRCHIPQTWVQHQLCHRAAMAVLWGDHGLEISGRMAALSPLGPAESLFKESYYQLMKTALKEDGILCCQGEHGHGGM